jgi:spore maturation protein CgeB
MPSAILDRVVAAFRRPAPPRPRVLFIGGFWMGRSDVVYQMYQALRDVATAELYDTDRNRSALDCNGRPYDYGFAGPVYIRFEAIERRIRRFRPDIIVCCAGGLSFRPEDLPRLAGVRLVGIALSDPDVFQDTTRLIARNFGAFYTNAASSVDDYRRIGVSTALLPFAANPAFHRRLAPSPALATDLLFVGNYRADRVETLRQLGQEFQLTIYGEGWEQADIRSRGHIEGQRMVRAINSARICLDFPRTLAGHDNVKVRLFEYGCCGALVFTARLDEVGRYFAYGDEIIGYTDFDDLRSQIRHYLANPAEAGRIRDNMLARCLRDHTWQQRWRQVLAREAN